MITLTYNNKTGTWTLDKKAILLMEKNSATQYDSTAWYSDKVEPVELGEFVRRAKSRNLEVKLAV